MISRNNWKSRSRKTWGGSRKTWGGNRKPKGCLRRKKGKLNPCCNKKVTFQSLQVPFLHFVPSWSSLVDHLIFSSFFFFLKQRTCPSLQIGARRENLCCQGKLQNSGGAENWSSKNTWKHKRCELGVLWSWSWGICCYWESRSPSQQISHQDCCLNECFVFFFRHVCCEYSNH